MGHTVELTAGDKHRLSAHLAEPAAKPRGGIVVIQEIFGVTHHIREVADQYAAAGYTAIAPALFDRVERGEGRLRRCIRSLSQPTQLTCNTQTGS
jgi:carboxymethylenebutenolidase